MKIEQCAWTEAEGWQPNPPGALGANAQLALVFGGSELFHEGDICADIRRAFPKAHVAGCSTAGEILGSEVRDQSLALTAVQFRHTRIRAASVSICVGESSREAGRRLAALLEPEGLVHVLILSDGLEVNGSELVAGITGALPAGVNVTGGLSADGSHFRSTRVMLDGPPREGAIAAVGFYGDRLRVAFGSLGGWDPFGPDRMITRSEGNVLYELDGRSALELYKKYLGDYAKDLPASGLLFPLLVRTSPQDVGVVRTILSVDEKTQSMTFAGDVPRGAYARLMKANFDRLIDGATGAARINHEAMGSRAPELALLISCVGRKLLLKQRTEEEVEAVRDVLGPRVAMTGFYSYGEISPLAPGVKCDLHNQTMTITTFSET